MPWLSVVIPLYNCEPYIAMCLDSILQQGLEESEYEVVVVNDGSTDKGADIASEYCKSYVNFRLLNKENGGISSARNLGMDEAKGEYIYFVDADDRLIANGMRTLYDSYLRGKKHPDMITFWSHTVDRYYKAKDWDYIRPHKELFRGSFPDYANTYGIGFAPVWNRILSRKFLVDNNIRFRPFISPKIGGFWRNCFKWRVARLLPQVSIFIVIA